MQDTIGTSLVLHKNQIPDFHKPVGLAVDHIVWSGAEFFTPIKMQFRTRPTRTNITHRPIIIFLTESHHPAILQLGRDLLPQLKRFVIVIVNRGVEFVGRQFQLPRHPFPAVLDRLFLEIIPKREITQHLKERMMPRREPDIIQIVVFTAGSDTFLR